jgi:Chemotaxis protein histidine kinase and related kinases
VAGVEAVAERATRLEAAFHAAAEPAAFWSQLRPGLAELSGLLDLPTSPSAPASARDDTEAPGAPADGAVLPRVDEAGLEEPQSLPTAPGDAMPAASVAGESALASFDDDRSLRELRAVFADEAAELIETVHQALDACERGAADSGLSDCATPCTRSRAVRAWSARTNWRASPTAWRAASRRCRTAAPDSALLAALRLDADHLLPPSAVIRVAAEVPTPDEAAAAEAPLLPTEHARVAVAELDRLLDRAAEAGILRSRMERHVRDLRGQVGELALAVGRARDQLRALEGESEARLGARRRGAHAAAQRYGDDEFDPLEMDRYTRMQELARALAETTSDLGALRTTLDGEVAGMEGLLRRQSRVQGEVRDGLTAALMVPLSRQVPRLMRLVRRLAEAQGRRATLEVDGASTGLDRTVLDRLMPALEHLLRNAVVHGIEPPAQRQARGKGEVGRIRLRARRDGARLTLSLSDDGAGLDPERIRRRAVELGRLADGQAVDRAQLTRLLFEPGFSTAAQLSADAGRGIGLDIVAGTLRALGGEIAVEGEAGVGTTFHLRLPLNLTLTQTLLVTVGAESYALPLGIVAGVMRLPAEDVARRLAEDGASVRYGDEDYELRPLVDLVEGQADPGVSGMRSLVLVRIAESVAASGQHIALLVDRLLGQREILLRPPGPQLAAVPGIVGATLLADGEIALVLDLPGLLTSDAVAAAPRPTAADRPSPLVMVVDDSVTVRRFTERLLRQNGYRVLTARDGAEAIALLDGERPDAMLLDIEMPRVDGFEVAQFVREQPRLAGLPLIVITSRSGDKHRSRAEALGVQAYLTKPYGDALLLAELARALEHRDD